MVRLMKMATRGGLDHFVAIFNLADMAKVSFSLNAY